MVFAGASDPHEQGRTKGDAPQGISRDCRRLGNSQLKKESAAGSGSIPEAQEVRRITGSRRIENLAGGPDRAGACDTPGSDGAGTDFRPRLAAALLGLGAQKHPGALGLSRDNPLLELLV